MEAVFWILKEGKEKERGKKLGKENEVDTSFFSFGFKKTKRKLIYIRIRNSIFFFNYLKKL